MITSGLRECFQIREDFMEEGTFKLGLETMGRPFGDVELKEKVSGRRDISILDRKRMAPIEEQRHAKMENAWETVWLDCEKQGIRLERLSRMKIEIHEKNE